MDAFRHKQMRSWIAASVVFAWLFTMGLCTVESHAMEAVSPHAIHLADHSRAGSHQHQGTHVDTCCQIQGTAIGTLTALKLPALQILVTFMPLTWFTSWTAFYTADPLQRPLRTPPLLRRRHVFLAHSLQPQAPPL